MKSRLLFAGGLLLAAMPMASAQSLRHSATAYSLEMGAYSQIQQDAFSFAGNQGALAAEKQLSAGIYSESRYLMEAIRMYAVSLVLPSAAGNFGVSVRYGGFSTFTEVQTGLAYGRKLGKKVAVGIQFNYLSYNVPTYEKDRSMNGELGLLLFLTEKLTAGLQFYNPVGGRFQKTGEKIPSVYKIGFGYDASDKFYLSAELGKEENLPVSANAGFQYQFTKQFFAKAGIVTASETLYFGAGLGWKGIRLTLNGSYHPQLGWSPGLSLVFAKPKEKAIPPLPQPD